MRYREVVKALKKNRWVEVRSTGSHHQFRNPDSCFVVTVPCHKDKDISIGVLKNIERTTGLSLRR